MAIERQSACACPATEQLDVRAGPFLTIKLCIPPLCPDLEPRPQLIARLDEVLRPGGGLGFGLTSAPAGLGKTTPATAWIRRVRDDRGTRLGLARLTLDDENCDPARFPTYPLAALRCLNPATGQTIEAIVQPPSYTSRTSGTSGTSSNSSTSGTFISATAQVVPRACPETLPSAVINEIGANSNTASTIAANPQFLYGTSGA